MFGRAEMEEIAEMAAKKAVNDMFVRLGVDPGDPIEAQKDFAHLRKWRKSVEAMSMKAAMTALVTIVTGALAALWVGIFGMKGLH